MSWIIKSLVAIGVATAGAAAKADTQDRRIRLGVAS